MNTFRIITTTGDRYTFEDKAADPQCFLTKNYYASNSGVTFLVIPGAIIALNKIVAVEQI